MELDGGHHMVQGESDRKRTEFLCQRGYRVLRFWDNEVLVNIDAVLNEIADALGDPHPSPLPTRERGN